MSKKKNKKLSKEEIVDIIGKEWGRYDILDEFENELNSGKLQLNKSITTDSDKMKELGFFDAGDYWLFSRDIKYLENKFSFYFTVYKDGNLKDMCILDEDFCQPYIICKDTDDPYRIIINYGTYSCIKYLIKENVVVNVKELKNEK